MNVATVHASRRDRRETIQSASEVSETSSMPSGSHAYVVTVAFARRPAVRLRRRRARGADEAEDAPPGVLARLSMLVEPTIEEGMRRAVVDDDLVRDAGAVERRSELLDRLRRDRFVGAAEQPEHLAAIGRR